MMQCFFLHLMTWSHQVQSLWLLGCLWCSAFVFIWWLEVIECIWSIHKFCMVIIYVCDAVPFCFAWMSVMQCFFHLMTWSHRVHLKYSQVHSGINLYLWCSAWMSVMYCFFSFAKFFISSTSSHQVQSMFSINFFGSYFCILFW